MVPYPPKNFPPLHPRDGPRGGNFFLGKVFGVTKVPPGPRVVLQSTLPYYLDRCMRRTVYRILCTIYCALYIQSAEYGVRHIECIVMYCAPVSLKAPKTLKG